MLSPDLLSLQGSAEIELKAYAQAMPKRLALKAAALLAPNAGVAVVGVLLMTVFDHELVGVLLLVLAVLALFVALFAAVHNDPGELDFEVYAEPVRGDETT